MSCSSCLMANLDDTDQYKNTANTLNLSVRQPISTIIFPMILIAFTGLYRCYLLINYLPVKTNSKCETLIGHDCLLCNMFNLSVIPSSCCAQRSDVCIGCGQLQNCNGHEAVNVCVSVIDSDVSYSTY